MGERLQFVSLAKGRGSEFCRAVAEGLSGPRKAIPSRFFYDREGSELFERITDLPEYYLTRTEGAIFERHADDILDAAGADLTLVEFGSGSSRKTRLLIEGILRRQANLDYLPIDISEAFLRESARTLLEDYAGLRVTALGGEYFEACAALPDADGARLILFLGSNLGNFERDEAVSFLTCLAETMTPRDRLLVGTDLVKERPVLEAAYNDPAGVTAAFNRNLLRRVNRELHGHFDLRRFEHHAPYDERAQRVEMRLVSRESQHVPIDDLDLDVPFARGETIHTEWSHKYTESSFRELAERAGLRVRERWTDEKDWFAVNLLAKA